MAATEITRSWLAAFVREAGAGVVATTNPGGRPEAALVGRAALDDGDLLFNTHVGSRKLANLAANQAIAVVVSVGEVAVQVEGSAEVLDGARRRRAGGVYERRFPGSSAMDESFALVLVSPRWMRYYDARPDSHEVRETDLSPRTAP